MVFTRRENKTFENRLVGDSLVVEVCIKDLDYNVATELKEHLVAAFEEMKDKLVIVDMTKVRFFDSSCLGAMFAAFRQTGSSSQVVLAAGDSEAVQHVLEVARIGKVMPVVRTVEEAMAIVADE